jgi:hypothetical protein
MHFDATLGTEWIRSLTRRTYELPLPDELTAIPEASANLYPSRNTTMGTREILPVFFHRLVTTDTPGIERGLSFAPFCD